MTMRQWTVHITASASARPPRGSARAPRGLRKTPLRLWKLKKLSGPCLPSLAWSWGSRLPWSLRWVSGPCARRLPWSSPWAFEATLLLHLSWHLLFYPGPLVHTVTLSNMLHILTTPARPQHIPCNSNNNMFASYTAFPIGHRSLIRLFVGRYALGQVPSTNPACLFSVQLSLKVAYSEIGR